MDNFIRLSIIQSLRKGEQSLGDICKYVGLHSIRDTVRVRNVLEPLIAEKIVGVKKYHWWKIRFYLIDHGDVPV